MPKKISDLQVNNSPSDSDLIPYSNGQAGADRGINFLGLKAMFPSKEDFEDKASLLANQIDAFADGTGKTYTSLSQAMAVDPLPENNTPFRVDGDTEDDGNYIYDSIETEGYKFLSRLVNNSDVLLFTESLTEANSPWGV